MSALGGIYNFDGKPAEDNLLRSLGTFLAPRAPDGGSESALGSVGMAYRAFDTHRESRSSQPLLSTAGHMLCWDGRLDNREDLIRVLGDHLLGDVSDVAVVMASYLRWGSAFAHHLIGDFALSLWDPSSRLLFLARDPVGPRTLYYHANHRRIIWSTELAPLLALPRIPLHINEEYIADYFTRLPEPSQTPYTHIHAVPPASTVMVKDGQLCSQAFWRLDPEREIRYNTDAQYEEHFRHLFREAVQCRLRATGHAWAELSGGLDSSSIVCMANRIIKDSQAPASSLTTVSYVFDEASEADERFYIGRVEEIIGKKGLYLREDDYRILAASGVKYYATTPNPAGAFAEYWRAVNQAMAQQHARVLLSGKGGDEIFSSIRNPAPELTDLLLGFQLSLLHRRAKVWSTALAKPYFGMLWHNAFLPILPRSLRPSSHRAVTDTMFELYDCNFVKRTNMRDRRRGPADVNRFTTRARRTHSTWFLRIVREIAAGFYKELSHAEIVYPCTHRPLVEFMQAIPVDQRVRPDYSRSLLRRALRDLLPMEVCRRREKMLSARPSLLAIARELPRLRQLFADARVCAYGYVDSAALNALLDGACHGCDPNSLSLTYVLPLEHWLRALERRRSSLAAMAL